MLSSSLRPILTLVFLLALCVSCTAQTLSPQGVAPSQPAVSQTDSPTTLTLVPDFTPTPILTIPSAPAPRRTPRATGVPSNDRGSDAAQDLPLDVPPHPIDVILGRPTQYSIVASILAYQDFEGFIEYGAAPDTYSNQTPLRVFIADQPAEVLIDSLQADTPYT
jgi:hypothetical protein